MSRISKRFSKESSPTLVHAVETTRNGQRPPLAVMSCDYLHNSNHDYHHTKLYEIAKRPNPSHLILRRGQVVNFILDFDRLLDPDYDSMALLMKYIDCDEPMVGQRSLAIIPLVNKSKTNIGKWDAWLEYVNQFKYRLKVLPPSDCIIGRWKMEIDSKVKNDGNRRTFISSRLLYIIFNAFCREDDVYVPPEFISEYLLNDTGLIYKGTRLPKPTHWVFGQFAKDVLDCSFYLVSHRAKLSVSMRSDPVLVTRALTAIIHSEFVPGVLLGNWSGDYSDGTRPQLWPGSAPILQQFYAKPEPVKYGQCWVYAGVMTTICRALGLGSRAVTCYSCGFGPDDTIQIDVHYFENPEMANKKNHRAYWNYHVWTETWMKRPDIGNEYSGWQVLDASPQFPSAGIICLGPAPVIAIKDAKFRIPYDCGFVYHEVNGDIHYWKTTFEGTQYSAMKLLGMKKKNVGWFIGTKESASWEIEDITDNYKYTESANGIQGRATKTMSSNVNNTRQTINKDFRGVLFSFINNSEVDIGQPIVCKLKLKNNSIIDTYKVTVSIIIKPISHSGEGKTILRHQQYNVTLGPKKEHVITLNVPYEEYGPYILEEGIFNCACLGRINSVDYDYYHEANIQLIQPSFKIVIPTATLNVPVTGIAEFVNPLNIPLTNGVIYIQGHFFKEVKEVLVGTVPPKRKVTISFNLTALALGDFSIATKFVSDQLSEVEGFATVHTVENPNEA